MATRVKSTKTKPKVRTTAAKTLTVQPRRRDITRSATMRDLRYNFEVVQSALDAGKPIQITKRGKVIATMTPEPAEKPPIIWPDFAAQRRAIFGDRVLKTSAVDLLRRERDERW